jgi:hypothetical protein
VLTRFAWPGYTLTLAEPRFCGVFSLLSAATSRTRGSANFQDYGIAGFPDHFLALVVRIGHSGASPPYGVVKTTQRVLALFHVL